MLSLNVTYGVASPWPSRAHISTPSKTRKNQTMGKKISEIQCSKSFNHHPERPSLSEIGKHHNDHVLCAGITALSYCHRTTWGWFLSGSRHSIKHGKCIVRVLVWWTWNHPYIGETNPSSLACSHQQTLGLFPPPPRTGLTSTFKKQKAAPQCNNKR